MAGRWGWAAGWRAATEAADERLRVAADRIASLEKQVAEQIERGDTLTDRLLAVAGVRGVARVNDALEQKSAESERLFLHKVAEDPFEEVPFGDDRGMYRSRDDALVDPDAREEAEK